MKRTTKMIGLCLTLGIFSGASYWAAHYYSEENAEIEPTTAIVFSVDRDTISKLDWTHEGEIISFEKTDNIWQYSKDQSFPLDESKFQSMLASISTVSSAKVIDTPEALSEYGLEPGECVIHATSDSSTTEFVIGNQTTINQERYLSIADGNVYIVSEDLMDDFSYGLYDLILKETLPSFENIQTISVSTSELSATIRHVEKEEVGEESAETETETEPEWFYTKNGEELAMDLDLSSELLQAINCLSLGACIDYNASEERLQELGFGDTELSVTVTDETESFSFLLSNDSSYIHLAGSTMVYEISTELSNILEQL